MKNSISLPNLYLNRTQKASNCLIDINSITEIIEYKNNNEQPIVDVILITNCDKIITFLKDIELLLKDFIKIKEFIWVSKKHIILIEPYNTPEQNFTILLSNWCKHSITTKDIWWEEISSMYSA